MYVDRLGSKKIWLVGSAPKSFSGQLGSNFFFFFSRVPAPGSALTPWFKHFWCAEASKWKYELMYVFCLKRNYFPWVFWPLKTRHITELVKPDKVKRWKEQNELNTWNENVFYFLFLIHSWWLWFGSNRCWCTFHLLSSCHFSSWMNTRCEY